MGGRLDAWVAASREAGLRDVETQTPDDARPARSTRPAPIHSGNVYEGIRFIVPAQPA